MRPQARPGVTRGGHIAEKASVSWGRSAALAGMSKFANRAQERSEIRFAPRMTTSPDVALAPTLALPSELKTM